MIASLYTMTLADRILGALAAGRSLHDICGDAGMPHHDTVLNWVKHDRDGFAARYRQARRHGHGCAGYVGYSRAVADRFLGEVMRGRSLAAVCNDPDMPHHATINRWVAADQDGFATRYRCARLAGGLPRAEVAYAPEIVERILAGLMSGLTLGAICADPEMPSTTSVRQWRRRHRDFNARYWQAREVGYHMICDEMLMIAHDRGNAWIARRRADGSIAYVLDPDRVKFAELSIRTRRWLLSKMMPKRFGRRPAPARPQPAGNDETADP